MHAVLTQFKVCFCLWSCCARFDTNVKIVVSYYTQLIKIDKHLNHIFMYKPHYKIFIT